MGKRDNKPNFLRGKVLPDGKICGIIGPVPIALLLVFSSVFLFLMSNNNNNNNRAVYAKQDQWSNYVPNLQDTWNFGWLKPEDDYTENCNFENYVLGQHADQEDPCLVAAFKKKMLLPPPPFEEQTHNEPNITGELSTNKEKFQWVVKLLIENSEKQDGFFIECGANDGEFISPTIRLEKKYNWTGLLIEANPIPFKTLMTKKRNAWAVNAAACINTYPEQITFYTNPSNTGLSGINQRQQYGVSTNVTVQCIPLYTMLKALEITTVDYLSLDVEGLELAILKTLPWDKISFRVMTIEHVSIPGGQQALKEFLSEKGYKFIKELNDALTRDSLYVHPSLYEIASKIKI